MVSVSIHNIMFNNVIFTVNMTWIFLFVHLKDQFFYKWNTPTWVLRKKSMMINLPKTMIVIEWAFIPRGVINSQNRNDWNAYPDTTNISMNIYMGLLCTFSCSYIICLISIDHMNHLPMFFRIASLKLEQSCWCNVNVNEVIPKVMGEIGRYHYATKHNIDKITMTSYWARWRLKSRPHQCLLNPLFGRRSKKTSKLRVTGLCGTGDFPAQMAGNAEIVSNRWRHHVHRT